MLSMRYKLGYKEMMPNFSRCYKSTSEKVGFAVDAELISLIHNNISVQTWRCVGESILFPLRTHIAQYIGKVLLLSSDK